MGSTDALLAIMLLVGFLGGIVLGIIVIVSIASRREDAHYSLDRAAPDAACGGVRRLNQAWVLGEAEKPAGYRSLMDSGDAVDAGRQGTRR
jgi:hypothetical protein